MENFGVEARSERVVYQAMLANAREIRECPGHDDRLKMPAVAFHMGGRAGDSGPR